MMALNEEQIAHIIERLPAVSSLRELAREMEVDPSTLRTYAQPYRAILEAQGALPPCACGKPRFHPFGCAMHTTALDGGLAAMPPERRAELLHRRSLFVSMLEGGARFFEIDAAMGATKGTARSYTRHLTPEQQQRRAAALRARGEP